MRTATFLARRTPMNPYNNPWLEGWMRAMNAASRFWLRPMGLAALPRTHEAEPTLPDPAEAPAPAVAASIAPRTLELTDIELRDALHARLAELSAFLNDTIAGQFVRRAAISEELDGLRSELDQALSTLDRLRQERDGLAAELAARSEAVEAERQALADRVLALELALGERDANLEALGADRDALVVRVDEVRIESGRMQDALDAEVRRLSLEVARLEGELGEAVRALEQVHGRADAGAARIAWLEPAVETMRAELDATSAERDALRERLAPLAEALEQARLELDSTSVLAPALEAVRADLEGVAAERDALALRVVALEGQLADRLAAHDSARHASAAREARIRELEPQLVALGSELDRVRREREQLAERVTTFESQLARALEDRAEAYRARDRIQAQANAMEPVMLGMRADVQRLAEEREALVGRVGALEAALVQRPSTTTTDPGSQEVPRTTGATPPDVQKSDSAATREPAAEPASARAWPFQLAAPAPEPAAASAPVTRLPSRRAVVELHFRKPPGWADTVFMHLWTPSGPLSVWPGVRMTAEGGGWYGGRAEGVGEVMVVFNDSCGHQTGDLRREGDGWFADGEWRDERPAGAADVVRLADYPGRGDKALPR